MENIALHYKNNPMVAGYDLMNEPDNAPSDSAVIAAYDRTLFRGAIRRHQPYRIY